MKSLNPRIVLAVCAALLLASLCVAMLAGMTASIIIFAGAVFGLALSAGSVLFGRSRRGQQYLKDLQSKPAAEQSQPKTLADVVRQSTTPPDERK